MIARQCWIRRRPYFPKQCKTRPLAISTWSVTRGQCRGLIQEKEFRPPARGHDCAPHAFKVKQADDPALGHIGAADMAVRIVQATTVAHKRAARARSDNLTERCYAVLIRHSSSFQFRVKKL